MALREKGPRGELAMMPSLPGGAILNEAEVQWVCPHPGVG